MTEAAHIFISYARQDGRPYAERLERELSAAGHAVWWDKRNLNPDQDFTAELEHAIAGAEGVVCCVTPDTRRDDSFVRREIAYAMAVRKPIIPLIFQDTLPPIHIINVTRVDFTRQSWETAMQDLMGRLRRDPGIDQTYEQTTLPSDPFRDYLNTLYQSIVRYLQQTVFSLITLQGEAALGAVEAAPLQGLPMAFFEIAGLDEPRVHHFKSFTDAYQEYHGRVLLLGDPGAGKTTTLMAFARDAVSRRLNDPTQPLPVLAPIATWDSRQSMLLMDWLLAQNPILKRDMLAPLVAEGRTLMLLDGLDELGSGEKPADNITENDDPRLRFLQLLPPNNQIVLSCRIKDYAQIGYKAALEGAVTLQPLDDTQMHAYMGDMPDLWRALENDEELRSIARTPLLLSLFMFAFNGLAQEAQQLHDLKRGDLRDKIFQTYVQRRYQYEVRKRREGLPYTLDQIYDVLGYIAAWNVENAFAVENVLNSWYFEKVLPVEQITSFTDFAMQLHLLVETEGEQFRVFRFIHLLIRDYFAYHYAVRNLEGSDTDTSYAALNTLGKLKDSRSIPLLIRMLEQGRWTSRVTAAEALGTIGDASAVEPLINALQSKDPKVRQNVAESLGKIGDKRAVLPLIERLADSSAHVRMKAAQALSQLNDPQAVEPVISLLNDTDRLVRRGVAEALGVMKDQRAFDALIARLSDDDYYVRMSAAGALGKLGDTRAIPFLRVLLNSEDAYVRSAAKRALAELGD